MPVSSAASWRKVIFQKKRRATHRFVPGVSHAVSCFVNFQIQRQSGSLIVIVPANSPCSLAMVVALRPSGSATTRYDAVF